MANERGGNDRRSMTISVAVLGVTLCMVFLAYFAFSEHSNQSDASTVEFATVVSAKIIQFRYLRFQFIYLFNNSTKYPFYFHNLSYMSIFVANINEDFSSW